MSNIKKYDYIDVMRAIAIMMIVVVHTKAKVTDIGLIVNILAQSCQMGVQLFFVASALTLCLSFESRKDEVYKKTNFFIRRFFRIAPLYNLGLLIYFSFAVLQTFYYHNDHLPEKYNLVNILLNMFLLHGFTPYVDVGVVPGGWTIGCEMTFYFIFPFLFSLFNNIRKIVIAIFIALCINVIFKMFFLAGLLGYDLEIHNNGVSYSFILNQISVFLVGFIMYHVVKRNYHWSKFITISLSILMFSVMLLVWRYKIFYPLHFMVIPLLAAISFLFLGLFLREINSFNKMLIEIGRKSYSIYIFHFIVVWILTPFINKYVGGFIDGNILLVIALAINICITFLISMLSCRFIEKPFIAIGKKFIEQREKVKRYNGITANYKNV